MKCWLWGWPVQYTYLSACYGWMLLWWPVSGDKVGLYLGKTYRWPGASRFGNEYVVSRSRNVYWHWRSGTGGGGWNRCYGWLIKSYGCCRADTQWCSLWPLPAVRGNGQVTVPPSGWLPQHSSQTLFACLHFHPPYECSWEVFVVVPRVGWWLPRLQLMEFWVRELTVGQLVWSISEM
jgi:hypothetical protein